MEDSEIKNIVNYEGSIFMSKNKGIKPEEKIQYVEEYLDGKISQSEIAKELGLKKESIRAWIAKYQSEGSVALLKHKQNRSYTPELKRQAVLDYLAGNGSMLEISKKYKIRSKSILERWIKVYNSGKDFKHKMSGGRRMKNTRKTTQEERIEIVKDCIANGYNYGEIALKYQVSYQQVYTWVKKFSELGDAGLEDRRGKRTAQQQPRTEEEELKIKVAQLEHELYMTRMERDLLKKLEEVERRDAYRK